MVKLIVRRFVELLIATFLIATATFFMVAAVPGDALSAQTDKLPAATRAQVYQNTGLDKPGLGTLWYHDEQHASWSIW
jgi:oligopeptide transport system permease protein